MSKDKDKLSLFLLQSAGKGFKDVGNCGFMLADWYMYATGRPDPVAHYRGGTFAMDTAMEHVSKIATELGLDETRYPKRGDIGIIEIVDKEGGDNKSFGAIFAGNRWILLANTGISGISPGSVVLKKAWRVQ